MSEHELRASPQALKAAQDALHEKLRQAEAAQEALRQVNGNLSERLRRIEEEHGHAEPHKDEIARLLAQYANPRRLPKEYIAGYLKRDRLRLALDLMIAFDANEELRKRLRWYQAQIVGAVLLALVSMLSRVIEVYLK